MRHRIFGKKLNRDIKERKALFRSLTQSLIKHGKVETTLAKAKAVRSLIEKLVTKAKDGSNASKIQISSFLLKKDLIDKLLGEIAPLFKDRVGGYIRIIRLAKERKGDSSKKVIIEWTSKKEEKQEKIKKITENEGKKTKKIKEEKKEKSNKK